MSARSVLVAALLAACVAAEASAYTVQSMEVFAEGKWRPATKTSQGQFHFEYLPGWPQSFSVRVTWLSQTLGAPRVDMQGLHAACEGIALSTPLITVMRNGLTQPGHPSKSGSAPIFSYEFQNVQRTSVHAFKALCKLNPDDKQYSVTGGATLNFQVNSALGWNPGAGANPWSKTYELEVPIEGQSLSRSEPLRVRIKSAASSASNLPVRLGLAIERAVSTQTGGVVGDIALPGNKSYTQWMPVKTQWLEARWKEEFGALRCSLQLPGYLGQSRTPEHAPGTYQIRILVPNGPSSSWRSFRVPAKPVLQKVK